MDGLATDSTIANAASPLNISGAGCMNQYDCTKAIVARPARRQTIEAVEAGNRRASRDTALPFYAVRLA
jgi:hypothetical protein